MRNLVGAEGWSGQARRLAGWLNPVVSSPAAPLETFAALDAVGPSLMPRTSRRRHGPGHPRGTGHCRRR
jgi:hypothetical protein